MTVEITLRVELDEAHLERLIRRDGFTLEQARTSALSALEDRAADSIRWHDAIAGNGVRSTARMLGPLAPNGATVTV